MQTESEDVTHCSLAETLEQTLRSQDENGPSIGELTDAVGDKGFGLLLIILSLPSALPVPAPGYSTPFGIAMAVIALQIVIGRKTVWLPEWVKKIRIKPALAKVMVGTGASFLRKIEHFIKPRQQWIHTPAGHAGLALIIFLMSVFMMIPIPLTNTLPAMAIFIIGVSMAEEDGLIAIAAFITATIAACASGTIVYLFITHGEEYIDGIKDWIKSTLFGAGNE